MSDLNNLYQQLIIDHGRNPRNFCKCAHANRTKDGYNPLCGDKITLYLDVDEEQGIIRDICFQGEGCAISTASASLMTEVLKGKTVTEALRIFQDFQRLVTESDAAKLQEIKERLGKLAALAGVTAFPMRVKCATLPWHTLKAALSNPDKAENDQDETVTTE